MSKRTATKEQQPDLLGAPTPTATKPKQEAPKVATSKGQVAKAKPPKPGTGVAKVNSLPPPKNMLAIIMQAVADPRCDVVKMQALLDMQRQIEHRDEVRLFNAGMLAVQEETPRIVKDRKNDHTKAKYPTLENVSKNLDPVARKHGFTMSWGTADSPLKDHYRVVCDLSHTGGDVRRYFVDLKADTAGPAGTKNKTDVQGVSSSISFGRRILKILMFDLTIVGDDQDGNGAKPVARGEQKQQTQESREQVIEGSSVALITDAQAEALVDAIEAAGKSRKDFCAAYKINKVADLEASVYEHALAAVRKLAKK